MFLPKKVLKSVFSLQALKVLELLIPLITLPIVLNSVGAAIYGSVALSQVIAVYIIMLLDFGYSSIGAKIHLECLSRNSKVRFFICSMFIKFIFTLLIIIPYLMLLTYYETDFLIALSGSIYIAFSVLSPTWILQAEYKLHYQAYISGISRVVFLLVVFFETNSPDFLYFYLPVLYLPQISIFFISIVYVVKSLELSMKDFMWLFSKKYYIGYQNILVEGWNVLSFRAFSASFNPLLMVFINHKMGESSVAIFSVAQKLNNAAIGMLMPFIQSAFPLLASQIKNGYKKFIMTSIAIVCAVTSLFLLYFLIVYFSVDELSFILNLLDTDFSRVVLISSFVIISSSLSSICSHLLILRGKAKVIKYIVCFSGVGLFGSLFLFNSESLLLLTFLYTLSQVFVCLSLSAITIRGMYVK